MKPWLLFFLSGVMSVAAWSAPPPASDVFQARVQRIDPNTFAVHWQIKPGYFLYRDRINLRVEKDSGVRLGDPRFPEPLKKTDRLGQTVTIFRNTLSLPVPVLGEAPGEALVDLHYQGCSDDGFCYPPVTRTIKLTLDTQLALTTAEWDEQGAAPAKEQGQETEQEKIESIFLEHHWAMILLTFYGFGLLLAFTPCVLPMVPVLSGIIVGHGHEISTRKAFFLSLSYVLSMAVTYALVGAIVAALGNNLQMIMQSPIAISLFSLLFVLLAISMFGYFELKLPVSWQARLALINRSQASGHYIGAAIMGCLSTLILSPCVTAPLIGVLSYIANDGNVALGGFSLFFLGLGMGTPLLLIGASAGRWLPAAGHWMNAVKYFFGVLLLAVAIYLMERILPAMPVMWLWAALLVFSGIYAGALEPAPSHHDKFKKSSGILALAYGLLILTGAALGNGNPLQPLTSRTSVAVEGSQLHSRSVEEVQQAIDGANDRPVMLDFYADWCGSCKIMEANVLNNPEVSPLLNRFRVLKIDVTANTAQNQALLRQYKVIAPPAFLFFDRQGQELPRLRLDGEVSREDFVKRLKRVADL